MEDGLYAFEEDIGIDAAGEEGLVEVGRFRHEPVQRFAAVRKVAPRTCASAHENVLRSDPNPEDVLERTVFGLVPRIVRDELPPDAIEFKNWVKGDARPFVREKIAASGDRLAEWLERDGVHFRECRIRIRIENEVLCEESGDQYAFRTLTVCPYEREAILPDMLTAEERAWLNEYHETVWQTFKDTLTPEVSAWLREETLPL